MGGLDGPPKPPLRSSRPGEAATLLDLAPGDMGRPRRAPQAPLTLVASRRSRDAPRSRARRHGGPSTGPPNPPTLVAPRRSRDAPRVRAFLERARTDDPGSVTSRRSPARARRVAARLHST